MFLGVCKHKGITPNLAGSDGKAQSTTKSAIAEGTIQITQNKDQDITDLSRDTKNANNPLTPIFDKNKILENQEAAKIFGEIGFTIVGDIISKNNWAKDDPRSIALHALVGGIMAEINGGKFGEGMSTAAINKLLIAELQKQGISGTDLRWISAALGEAIDGGQGRSIADSATRNNALSKEDKEVFDERFAQCKTEEEKQELIKEFIKKSGVQETDIYTGDVIYSIDKNGNFYVSDALEMTAENFIKLTSTTAGGVIIALGTATGGALASEYIIVKLSSGAVVKVASSTLFANPSIREKLLNSVSNQKLRNAVSEIYRPGGKVGDGGLADAIRHEIATGELVGGVSHIIKGTERVKNLEKIIQTQKLNQNDFAIANDILNNLKKALEGK